MIIIIIIIIIVIIILITFNNIHIFYIFLGCGVVGADGARALGRWAVGRSGGRAGARAFQERGRMGE